MVIFLIQKVHLNPQACFKNFISQNQYLVRNRHPESVRWRLRYYDFNNKTSIKQCKNILILSIHNLFQMTGNEMLSQSTHTSIICEKKNSAGYIMNLNKHSDVYCVILVL